MSQDVSLHIASVGHKLEVSVSQGGVTKKEFEELGHLLERLDLSSGSSKSGWNLRMIYIPEERLIKGEFLPIFQTQPIKNRGWIEPGSHVSQGECAYSIDALETSGLDTCVGLGITVSSNGNTFCFLAHVDAFTDYKSLQRSVDNFFGRVQPSLVSNILAMGIEEFTEPLRGYSSERDKLKIAVTFFNFNEADKHTQGSATYVAHEAIKFSKIPSVYNVAYIDVSLFDVVGVGN